MALGHKIEIPEFLNGPVLRALISSCKSRFVYDAPFTQIKPQEKRSVFNDNVCLKRLPT